SLLGGIPATPTVAPTHGSLATPRDTRLGDARSYTIGVFDALWRAHVLPRGLSQSLITKSLRAGVYSFAVLVGRAGPSLPRPAGPPAGITTVRGESARSRTPARLRSEGAARCPIRSPGSLRARQGGRRCRRRHG